MININDKLELEEIRKYLFQNVYFEKQVTNPSNSYCTIPITVEQAEFIIELINEKLK